MPIKISKISSEVLICLTRSLKTKYIQFTIT